MTPPVPFHDMAISLSGGGYRATTFHLGALSLLDTLQIDNDSLLKNVKILSTISGGTLTGVMYALKLADKKTFDHCFHKLYDLLEADRLVDKALDKINTPAEWPNKFKTRDLINSFSEVYNKDFYDQATFAKLFDAEKIHLKDIIFGTSEFTTGIQFRFQEEHDKGKFGNGNLEIPDDVNREIRLADAAAASSCFPGGFEPMIMPKDFANGDDSPLAKYWYSKVKGKPKMVNGKAVSEAYPTTAIMDGGILDNQGIEGVKLAEKRQANKHKRPFIGTYIISDVSSEKMEPYPVPMLEHSSFKNIFRINRINIVALLLMILSIAGLIFDTFGEIGTIIATCLLTIIGFWFVLFLIIRSLVRREVKDTFQTNQVPELLSDFRVLTRTPIYILVYLFKFRASSVMKMVSDVFLRRIRSLQLDSLFDSSSWRGRIQTNNIYTLEKFDEKTLGKQMHAAMLAANKMPTTLWFSQQEKDDNVLDDLIACGQFTLCFNLMEYSNRIKSKKYRGEEIWPTVPQAQKEAIESLHEEIVKSWAKFKEDPYWLIKQYKSTRPVDV